MLLFGQFGLQSFQLFLGLLYTSVPQFGHFFVVAVALGPFGLDLVVFDRVLGLLYVVYHALFAFPLGKDLVALVLKVGEFGVQRF